MDIIAKWTIIILLIFMIGCASVKTTLTSPEGNTWTVISKKDSLVKFKTPNIEGEVDNRGKLGIVESMFGILIMKTDIELSNRDRSD